MNKQNRLQSPETALSVILNLLFEKHAHYFFEKEIFIKSTCLFTFSIWQKSLHNDFLSNIHRSRVEYFNNALSCATWLFRSFSNNQRYLWFHLKYFKNLFWTFWALSKELFEHLFLWILHIQTFSSYLKLFSSTWIIFGIHFVDFGIGTYSSTVSTH